MRYTGWPRKNATLMIFQENEGQNDKLCSLLRIEFFSQQDDTKIINFEEGFFFILWPFF